MGIGGRVLPLKEVGQEGVIRDKDGDFPKENTSQIADKLLKLWGERMLDGGRYPEKVHENSAH